MAVPRPRGVSGVRLLVVAVAAAVVGAGILASYLYADRTPAPHGVTVDVVAPPAVADQLRGALDAAAPGGFVVHPRATESDALDDLRHQQAQGALVLSGTSARILTAGAGGPSLKQVVTAALTPAASRTGQPVVEDVVPLPSGDLGGAGVFVVLLALLLPSVMGSVGLYLVGLRARLWWRVGAAALFAALVATAVVLIADLGLGVLTGAWPALLGLAVLGAITFATTVAAAQATLGLPGTGLAALVLILVGNAASGGPVPTALLPDGYRPLSDWLPNGAIIHALRAAVYFDGHGIGQPLVALFAWFGGAVIVLLANDLVHLRLGRRQPHRRPEIYATPGVAHLVRWIRRERFHGAHEAGSGEPGYLDRAPSGPDTKAA
jgi:hypothetical protein